MISNPKTETFTELDAYFLDLQYNYLKIFSAYNSDLEHFQQLKLSWHNDSLETERSQITNISLFKEEEFAEEIKHNVIYNFSGAIDYFKLVIAKQHQFAKSHFPNTLNKYLTKNEQSIEILSNADTDIYSISHEYFLQAVQIEFIDLSVMIERDFYLQYPFYTPLFSMSMEYKRELPRVSRIKLDYGDEAFSVLKELHGFLNETYIENIDFDKFERHFTKGGNFPKIIWKEPEVILLLLFRGKKLPPEYNIKEFIMLKTLGDPLAIICDHFEKKDKNNKIEKFERLKLNRNSGNLKKDSLNRGSGPLVTFIRNLNLKYAPNALPIEPEIINRKSKD